MVRATRRTLSWARAERPSSSIAALRMPCASGFKRAELADLPGRHPAVDDGALASETVGLAGAGLLDFGQEVRGGGARRGFGKLGEGDGGDLDVEVDPVEQRAGDLAQILFDLRRRAATRPTRVGSISARTWIHRGDQDEFGRERCAPERAADRDVAFLERLAEDFEGLAVELGQLVEKQHALMGQARSRRAAACCRRRPGRRR